MERELKRIFGDRVSFDKIERVLYSHDVANLPGPVEKMVQKTADAVVQPQTSDEIIQLVHYAKHKRIPLTPRGAGTSGYGGVLPLQKGIVVSFACMKKIKSIDPKNMTVTVEPGIVWAKLEEELNKESLALRTKVGS